MAPITQNDESGATDAPEETPTPKSAKRRAAKRQKPATPDDLAGTLGVRLKMDRFGNSLNRFTHRGRIYEGGYVYVPSTKAERAELMGTGFFEIIEIDENYERVSTRSKVKVRDSYEIRGSSAPEGVVNVGLGDGGKAVPV